MPFETHPEIHRQRHRHDRTCVKSNDRRLVPFGSIDAFLRQGPTNADTSAVGINNQGSDDGPRLIEVGRLRTVRWYIRDRPYDASGNFSYHNLAGLCETGHSFINRGQRGPIGVAATVLLKCPDRETIDLACICLAKLSENRRWHRPAFPKGLRIRHPTALSSSAPPMAARLNRAQIPGAGPIVAWSAKQGQIDRAGCTRHGCFRRHVNCGTGPPCQLRRGPARRVSAAGCGVSPGAEETMRRPCRPNQA
jgi:hypothetical protein